MSVLLCLNKNLMFYMHILFKFLVALLLSHPVIYKPALPASPGRAPSVMSRLAISVPPASLNE